MRKFLKALVLVPLAIVILAFAVANREIVRFTLDPLGLFDGALTFSAPLFALAFAVLIAGVIVGGVAAWLRQSQWRRATRLAENELRNLRAENVQLRHRIELAEAAARTDAARLRPPAA
jgi:uncharacterized integral membrane protein